MSEYQLKTWLNYVSDKHGKDYQSALAELQRPDLTEMVMHYFNESQRAFDLEQQNEKAEPDHRWQVLSYSSMEALSAITSGDPREIASTFYNLGQVAESLIHPPLSEQAALHRAYS